MGTLLLAGVAAENFFRIDQLLNSPSHPSFQNDVARRPPGEARTMLRYLASELNRSYFRAWGWVQLVLGTACLSLAAMGLKQRKFTVGFSLMLASAAVMVFYITPQIVDVGRSLDFVPRQPPPPGIAAFGRLHAAYTILDIGKLLVGVWMAVALVHMRRGRTKKIDPGMAGSSRHSSNPNPSISRTQ